MKHSSWEIFWGASELVICHSNDDPIASIMLLKPTRCLLHTQPAALEDVSAAANY